MYGVPKCCVLEYSTKISHIRRAVAIDGASFLRANPPSLFFPFRKPANNVSEMLTALVSEVAGTTLFAYVIGALVTIVLNLDPQTRLRKQKVRYFSPVLVAAPHAPIFSSCSSTCPPAQASFESPTVPRSGPLWSERSLA